MVHVVLMRPWGLSVLTGMALLDRIVDIHEGTLLHCRVNRGDLCVYCLPERRFCGVQHGRSDVLSFEINCFERYGRHERVPYETMLCRCFGRILVNRVCMLSPPSEFPIATVAFQLSKLFADHPDCSCLSNVQRNVRRFSLAVSRQACAGQHFASRISIPFPAHNFCSISPPTPFFSP